MEELDAALERRDKAELILLIKQMVRQQPDLELLLAPLPTVTSRASSMDPEVYRKQAERAFQQVGNDYGVEQQIARGLRAVTALGDGFTAQVDAESALAVYVGVAGAILEHFVSYGDEEGALAAVLREIVEGLDHCLIALQQERAARQTIVETLFAIFRYGNDYRDLEASGEAGELLVSMTTPEERALVGAWVRETLPTREGLSTSGAWLEDHRRQALGAFLLELEAERLDDEGYLDICRQTGQLTRLVERLLELGRTREAREAARTASDFDVLQLADLLLERGHPELAEQIMQDRIGSTQDSRVADWLKRKYVAEGNTAPALTLAEHVFRGNPTLLGYHELRRLAHELDRWHSLQPEVLASVKRVHDTELLIRIYLEEGDIDAALTALPGLRAFHDYETDLHLEIAEAAEGTRPQAALEIYRRRAEQLIADRSRVSYQQAALMLSRAHALYERIGDAAAWNRVIAEVRQEYRALGSLQQELTAAGL